jgi:hypothetical protein
MKRAACARDGGAGLPEVRDVVQRVVQAEDVDPVLRGARHETADDVAADRARPDEEAAAERDPEGVETRDLMARIRSHGLSTRRPNGGVEHPSARDLEARESRAVEDLRHAEHLRRRELASERLLREQADRRVDELRHSAGP